MKNLKGLFFVLLVLTALFGLVGYAATSSHPTQAQGTCGLTNPAFCETFDAPSANLSPRTGQLNSVLWGVSRGSGDNNIGNVAFGMDVGHNPCAGGAATPPDQNDVMICNGQLVEVVNGTGVDVLAMYPKQPFDFAGRTGKIVFDVSTDVNINSHSFWPEFWLTDKPVPAPFEHLGSWVADPKNGFGLRFESASQACNNDVNSISVDSAVVVRNYASSDNQQGTTGAPFTFNTLGCVARGNGSTLNHFEVDVSTTAIDVYGTNPGQTSPLVHLASIPDANLQFSRGLLWLEHGTYDGEKFGVNPDHAFKWDNVGFDGPVLPRDIGYEVTDSLTPAGDGTTQIGWAVSTGQPHVSSVNIDCGCLGAATGALLEFYHYEYFPPISFTYSFNGHPSHTYPWPYPDTQGFTPKTIAIPVDKSELQAGSNTIGIYASDFFELGDIDLILVAAGSGNGTPVPTTTPTLVPTNTPTPVPGTPTPTPVPSNRIGVTTIGPFADSCDAGGVNGQQITPTSAITLKSISVFVDAPIGAAPNNQFQLAVYKDAASPTLVAHTATGTLGGNAWNTLPITAALSANTAYWLMYEPNGLDCTVNNEALDHTNGPGVSGYDPNPVPFGSWPASLSFTTGVWPISIYASY